MVVKNEQLKNWVKEVTEMCLPDTVHWCDGSKAEYDRLMSMMVKSGSAIPLKKRKNSFLFRSDPSDVARVEARTYISTPQKMEAGPTNNWIDPQEL
jgi:phosphoenolpyruvate carboxykinase (GTP)